MPERQKADKRDFPTLKYTFAFSTSYYEYMRKWIAFFLNPKYYGWYGAIIIIYLALPLIFNAFYNYPAQDDYYAAVLVKEQGFFQFWLRVYNRWSGRVFAATAGLLNPLNFNSFLLYKLYAALFVIGFIGSLYLLIRVILRNYCTSGQIVLTTSIIAFVYIAQMPGTAEGFYWFSASITYMLANINMFLLLSILLTYKKVENKYVRTVLMILGGILCACIAGSNECSCLVLDFIVLIWILLSTGTRRHSNTFLFALFGISVIVTCIMVLSPGNHARFHPLEDAGLGRKTSYALISASLLSFLSFIKWSGGVLVGFFAYALFTGVDFARKNQSFRATNKILLWCLFISVVIPFLLYFLAIWYSGMRPPKRIENAIYLFFVISWFVTLQLLLIRYYAFFLVTVHPIGYKLVQLVGSLLFVFYLFSIDGTNNILTAYLDIFSGKVSLYSKQWSERIHYFRTEPSDTCVVQAIRNVPQTIFYTDFTPEGEVVHGESLDDYVAKYFHKSVIKCYGKLPEKETNYETILMLGKKAKQEYRYNQ